MNLFGKRPLALICAVIIFVSFFAHRASLPVKLIMLAAALLLLVVAFAVSLKSANRKMGAILICLCAAGAMLAVSAQLVATDMRAERARSLEGSRSLELLIIDEGDSGRLESYKATVRDVDGKRVSFDANLYLSFEGNLDAGDVVRVSAEVYEAGRLDGYFKNGADLDVFVYDGGKCALVSEGNFSLGILFGAMRSRTAEYLSGCFGERCGALARGILLGDTDGIDGALVRDFRRSGTSHLLAVSGLHISMLVAMVELILRGLSVGRRARCAVISLLSLVFLGMTGFAMSACRSVLMLLFVYLHYMLVKESDSLTALFGSVAVIMLISPSAALDVGLWLSFLATLGIISVYNPMSRYIKKPRRGGFWFGVLRVLKSIAEALLLCFVCNVFTAFVVWGVFGEISVVTLISNLVLTPLSLVFLVMIPIGMIFANFGVVGDIAVGGVRAIAELTEYLCGVFSGIDGAIISLRYGFAGVIIIAMSAALAVMLVINMKRKPLIFLPPIAAVVAFVICLSLHNAVNASNLKLTYRCEGSNEMLLMNERSEAAVIDISSGSYGFMSGAVAIARQGYATEIGDLVLTHYHESHSASVEIICERIMLRRIYLPTPSSAADLSAAHEIAAVAEIYGCEVIAYESGDTLALLSDTRVRIDAVGNDEVAVFAANDNEALAYIGKDLSESEGAQSFSSLADHIISGVHGAYSKKDQRAEESKVFILH